jgi:hypothetical protein
VVLANVPVARAERNRIPSKIGGYCKKLLKCEAGPESTPVN